MQENKKNILLVEDDVKLAEMTKEYLEQNQYVVSLEHDGANAVERILLEKPDVLILDLMLPNKDGISICREVRQAFENPILIVTARDDEVDEIVSIEIGADDYITKPIKPRILLARISNLLRRYEKLLVSGEEKSHADNQHGRLQLDAQRRVAIVDGREVNLTSCEFDLLNYFFSHQGVILPRDEIYRQMRGIDWDGADRSIDLRVSRLRNTIGDNGKSPRFIKSVRGTGYMLVAQDAAPEKEI